VRSLVLLAFLAASPLTDQPQSVTTASAPTALPSPAIDSRTPLRQPPPNSSTPSQIDIRIHDLEREVDSLKTLLTGVAGILAVILTLGTGASLLNLYRSDRRTEEAHRLGIAGEEKSQSRATDIHHSFLEGSKTTLELVNATLTLARDASERASKVLEVKARGALEDLDKDAKHLLAKTKSNDRALVRDPAHRSALISLAQRLEAFEINRFILPPDIKLTPPCLFLRGMEQHLKQHFEDALAHWDQVALNDSADPLLRALAWLWIGYEYNNLGQFSDAVSSFENALTFASGARRFELQRM
jgi:tetratricopeptide (TPR) repeat protein